MKFLIFSTALVLSQFTFAANSKLVKSCFYKFDITNQGHTSKKSITYNIYQNNKEFSAQALESTDQKSVLLPVERASASEHIIRENLSESTQNMNDGEKMILATQMSLIDPKYSQNSKLKLENLSKISSIKMYQTGELDDVFWIAIIEAYDKHGASVGSFVTGMVVPSLCE